MRRGGRLLSAAGTLALALGIVPVATAAPVEAAGVHVCSGTPSSPGVLTGTYASVVVRGACAVNAGRAHVLGQLTIDDGSGLVAAFARNDRTGRGASSLTVDGNVVVRNDAAMILGCLPTSFPCLDDNPNHPTLSSFGRVGGDVIEYKPLGVIVHNSSVGNVTETGGGGGVNCTPHGIFAAFQSPAYSDYEDSWIHGNLEVNGVRSCWLGLARDHVYGTVRLRQNQYADPDAIEILANTINGDLICRNNSMVWDNADLSTTGSLFPRQPEPNRVTGHREGQCILSSPNTAHDQPGPGPF